MCAILMVPVPYSLYTHVCASARTPVHGKHDHQSTLPEWPPWLPRSSLCPAGPLPAWLVHCCPSPGCVPPDSNDCMSMGLAAQQAWACNFTSSACLLPFGHHLCMLAGSSCP